MSGRRLECSRCYRCCNLTVTGADKCSLIASRSHRATCGVTSIDLGYAVSAVKGPGAGYRLATGSELPPLLCADEQAVSTAGALQSMPSNGIDLDEAAVRVLMTVRQVVPSRLRHRTHGIRFIDYGSSARVGPKVIELVRTATREPRTIGFDYGDVGEQPPKRVEPHAVVARNGRWYLIAWDFSNAGRRIYRLDKMAPKFPAGAPFTRWLIPTRDARTYLAARSKDSDGADVWL